jgi:CRP-like cAMP-binding protein
VNVTSHDETGKEVELASLGPGDYFGETGLLRRIPRTATVTAASTCRLLRIAGLAFLEAVSSGASLSLLVGAQAPAWPVTLLTGRRRSQSCPVRRGRPPSETRAR